MRLISDIPVLLYLSYAVLNSFLLHTLAYEVCSNEAGGEDGICPNGDTCCRRPDNSWGCIASDMGRYTATCCSDDSFTGCPVGYTCRSEEHDCMALNNSTSHFADPLTRVLPRYRLCHANEIRTVHGLLVNASSTKNSTIHAEIPYFSNMGPLERIPANVSSTVDMALIIIHGATRNGDDYFCAAKATLELQDRFSNVLILSLNYYSVSDDRPRHSLLYWNSKDADGQWRYGADSGGPVRYSSFSVLDQVVGQVQRQFANLQRITVTGHSAGGQLTQRWALLSDVPQDGGNYHFQTVVANPSNYAYLSPHRYMNGSWTIPNNINCPDYDKWEWGLQSGGDADVRYRDEALAKNVTAVLERYKTRNVYYLVGGLDRCNVSESEASGWCHSHGLETKCMDMWQGSNRYERNSRYVASLRRLGFGGKHHQRLVIPGVGHDHSMMFQSPNGIHAIYYGVPEGTNVETAESS
ncbi:hypothetical protein IV203_038103 [Nitzschia inconspicua]|uniref:Uncharacterized protein n=1 Tax=Nitzschia inconspicua TaxID=303405 RepID=A0A9K3PZH9_9STRA|nr:hypothetical protein IV203_038103 [Nitzschia inconspicua]